MHYGFGIVREMIAGLENYMDEKGFKTLDDMVGKSLQNVLKWENLNLKYKVVAEINTDKCIGCQLCYIACEDGAHQAIGLSGTEDNRVPHIIEENCVGCNLCSLVCPVEECITMVRRDDGKEDVSWTNLADNNLAPTEFEDEKAGGRHHWVPAPADALKK